jgi:hypothetical protein
MNSARALYRVKLARMAKELENIRYFKIEVPMAAAKLRNLIAAGGVKEHVRWRLLVEVEAAQLLVAHHREAGIHRVQLGYLKLRAVDVVGMIRQLGKSHVAHCARLISWKRCLQPLPWLVLSTSCKKGRLLQLSPFTLGCYR